MEEIYSCKLCNYIADTRHQSCILTHLQDKHKIFRNNGFYSYLVEHFNSLIPRCGCNQCELTPTLRRKGIVFNIFADGCPYKGRYNNPCCIEFYLFRGIPAVEGLKTISDIQSKSISSKHKAKLARCNNGPSNPMSLVNLTKRLGSVKLARNYLKNKGIKYSGENAPFYGKTHTKETLIKLAKTRSNIPKMVTKPELVVFGMLISEDETFSEDNFQYPIGKYIVDFVIGDKIIEVFGNYFHDTKKFKHVQRKEKDKAKTQYLKDNGFDVLILFEDKIMKTPREALKEIRNFLCA